MQTEKITVKIIRRNKCVLNNLFQKKLSIWHKLKFSNPYIYATWWCKTFYFKFRFLIYNRILSLKYLSSTTLGCKDKGIRQFEFVAKTHFLCPGPDVTGPFDRPKFSAPIWLDEIQNNKIFNKQRNLLGTVNTVKINIK